MSKTITIRVDDDLYEVFRRAAEGERRSISNFIEFATLSYLTHESTVTDREMGGILGDAALVKSLRQGLGDIKKGKYTIVR
ncbi:MAG: ribbon-helix-helix protein, CopG family [Spirochaetes bacterium]|nr:ribbon-helix-helix protein, CopG family [Spirochaetota bacterium]